MNKIADKTLAQCTIDKCCLSELFFLPVKGDVGFKDYYDYKAKLIGEKKRSLLTEKQGKLMLAYPAPDASEEVFAMFFESPYVVADNHEFDGCFAIDITDYINKTEDTHFFQLISYMYNNPEIVFLLFIRSDNINECENMYNFLTQYIDVRKMSISLPAINDLVAYTLSKTRDFCEHIERDCNKVLKKFFSIKPFGYDIADYLIRRLKNSDFNGDVESLKKEIEEIEKTGFINAKVSGIGY